MQTLPCVSLEYHTYDNIFRVSFRREQPLCPTMKCCPTPRHPTTPTVNAPKRGLTCSPTS